MSKPHLASVKDLLLGKPKDPLLTIPRLFPNHFKNVVFISDGVIDSGQFKGREEIENLR